MSSGEHLVDRGAERAVLGSILLDKKALLAALEHVRAKDFADGRHQVVFGAMHALGQAGDPIDLVSLSSSLRAQDRFEAAGGAAGLAELMELVPTAANVEHYAKRVADRAALRRFLSALQRSVGEIERSTESAEVLISRELETLIAAAAQGQTGQFIRADRAAPEWFERLQDLASRGEVAARVPTGFLGFDDYDRGGGFRPGQLVIVGARPGVGKTALALNIAINAGQTNRVVVVSLEMGLEALVDRLGGIISGLDTRKIERPYFFTEADWVSVRDSAVALSEARLEFWVPAGLSIDRLMVGLRRQHALQPMDLVIVDYLGLLAGDPRGSREQEIASVSRGLKTIARELGTTVLALSQLNREVERRDDPVPRLSDLRDSGSIEQDADVVAFLHRPYVFDRVSRPSEALLIVAKNRAGPIASFPLCFDPPTQRFSDQKDSG